MSAEWRGEHRIGGSARFRDVGRAFFRNKLAVTGLAMVMVVFLAAVLAPAVAPYDPQEQNLAKTQANPSRRHPMGTDELGRDQLSRVLYGSRLAVTVAVAAVLLALALGVAVGALAGILGRRWDSALMRTADAFLAFPVLIGAMVIVVVMGRGVPSLILAIALFSWATFARVLRSSMLSVREAPYVEAARSLGATTGRVLVAHVLPNSIAPVIVYAAVSVGLAVTAHASLSFLGVGVSVETADWGVMIATGRRFVGHNDFLWIFPSLAVIFTVLGFAFVGDGLRDALDPRDRRH